MVSQIRTLAFDAAGLAFVAASVYVGVVHGVVSPDFTVFASMGAAYLGFKAPGGGTNPGTG